MAKLIKKEEPNIVWTDDPNYKAPKKAAEAEIDPKNLELHIKREVKGRGGKTVCVIDNFPQGHSYFKKLVKKLKRVCGTGGTFKGDAIEVQGDHRDKLREFFEDQGFKVKFTGG